MDQSTGLFNGTIFQIIINHTHIIINEVKCCISFRLAPDTMMTRLNKAKVIIWHLNCLKNWTSYSYIARKKHSKRRIFSDANPSTSTAKKEVAGPVKKKSQGHSWKVINTD